MNNTYQKTVELNNKAVVLLNDVTTFVADRSLSAPKATANWTSADEWFQKSVEYSNLTNNLFTNRFYQRITDISYQLQQKGVISQEELQKGVISQEELKNINFWNNPQYPAIDFIIRFLQDYCSRIKK